MVDYDKESNNGPDIVNPEGSASNDNVIGTLERQADFASRVSRLTKSNLDRRPDSISLDYLTAFCLGPVANGDTSLGVISHIWYTRVDNASKKIYIARENDAKNGWNIETELFSFDDTLGDIIEVDIAFEQTARPVICAERATGTNGAKQVWLYWFNSVTSTFGFDNFGTGRTPRVILDSPFNVSDSDVLFFYLTATKLVYRQQRDRYAVEIETTLNTDANTYIEDVVKLRDGRIKIEGVQHNLATGRYTIIDLTSTLFPHITDVDKLTLFSIPVSSDLIVVLIVYTTEIDNLQFVSNPISGTLVIPIINITTDIDNLQFGTVPISGTLALPIITQTIDIDNIKIIAQPISGTLVVVVITSTLTIENLQFSAVPISGLLEVV